MRPLIIFPENILEEEKIELAFKEEEFDKPLTIVAWRSLYLTEHWEVIQEQIPKDYRYATILRWAWSYLPYKNKLIDQIGFKKIFCTSIDRNIHAHQISYIDYVRPEIYYSEIKDIWFSFVGWNENRIRNRIFELFPNVSSVIKREVFNHKIIDPRQKEYERKQYEEILARSRFSLCPRGTGSGTIRFWESLKAGAIPLMISDEHELPKCWDWKNTILQITEYQHLTLKNKIHATINIPYEREQLLRKNCLAAYEYFYNPKNLVSYIKQNL